MGAAGAFSFYPGKNLGACGEAGALTTNDEKIANTARMLRDHGQAQKYIHDLEGYNGRLDAIQAGFLQVKLKRLSGWNESRRKHAERYALLLQDLDGITLPFEPEWSKGVYHLYVIRTKDRDALQKFLLERNISHRAPLSDTAAPAEGLSRNMRAALATFPKQRPQPGRSCPFPMFPTLTEQQQDHVAAGIREFATRHSGVVSAA